MFCYQCQEASKNTGCTVVGVCGKNESTAKLQDLLIWLSKGISWFAARGRTVGAGDPQADLFVAEALFSTVTNVNFDSTRFVELVREALSTRDSLRSLVESALKGKGESLDSDLPAFATWAPASLDLDTLAAQGAAVGVMSDSSLNPDIRSLRDLLTIGLKGLAAYTDHAVVLDRQADEILTFIEDALLATTKDDATADELVGWVLKAGEKGVQAMALLDEANTSTYGHPEPTSVNLGVKPGPAILISGHDLRDLAELLEQTQGTGVNVYTHGEMLPALAYPAFKKYDNLVGNYGGSWWHQQKEFESFNGAILMTTNCVVKPRESYKGRLFTTGLVGWDDVAHILDRKEGGQKDFSKVIEKALACESPVELESGTMTIGFAHQTVLSQADAVLGAIKSGALKRFVVMAGCDGRQGSRSYFTEVAEALPKDHIILTAGCAKYRYNKLNLGDIGGIPRVLDAGQCNDSYSLAVVALKLKEVLGLEDINELPISYDIAWYEQKAVIVLLALLFLGVKHIRLGPTLPAFLSPNVVKVLVENFDILPITDAPSDVAAIAAGQ